MSTTNPYAPKTLQATKKPKKVETEVPNGTIREIEDWVGEDQVRAQTAIGVEESREKPRTTLLTTLRSLLEDE